MSAHSGAAQGGGGGDWGSGPPAGAAGAGGPEPSEEELREAYEAELSRITTTDMIAQTVISLLNLGARRLGGPDEQARARQAGEQGQAGEQAQAGEQGQAAGAAGVASAGRDLEQVRDAIDGVRALMGILERRIGGDLGPLRDALSQLQMAYARAVQAGGGGAQPGAGGAGGADEGSGKTGGGSPGQGGGEEGGQAPPGARRPGPAETSGRLWVPGR
jgi:hypothetical protein